jgi:hypothetical protein
MFKKIHEKVKKLAHAILAVVTPLALFFTYFVGLALTWLAAIIFDRRLLKDRNREITESSWQDVKGYSNKIEDLQKQF